MVCPVGSRERRSGSHRSLAVWALALACLLAFSGATGTSWANPGDGAADRVFGQLGNFTTADCNLGGASAISLCFPTGVTVDAAGNVWVVDSQNARVLEYDNPLLTDTVADRVLGQPNLTTRNCGIGAAGLCLPHDVAVDATGNVYVSDKNRVLEYDKPILTDTIADRVFGQAGNFATQTSNLGGISASSLSTPIGLSLDLSGNLFVADADNNRVLEFDSPLTTDTVADRVFGQSGSMTSGKCNLTGLGNPASANTLCVPAGIATVGPGNLYVADAGNSRALEYNSPLSSDSTADHVFGQAGSFTSYGCNIDLCAPQSVAIGPDGSLYIVDAHSRVLWFEHPLTNSNPDRVIGQPNFSSVGCNQNQASPTDATICYANELWVDNVHHLYVADTSNNRVLEFDNPVAVEPVGGSVMLHVNSQESGVLSIPPLEMLAVGPGFVLLVLTSLSALRIIRKRSDGSQH